MLLQIGQMVEYIYSLYLQFDLNFPNGFGPIFSDVSHVLFFQGQFLMRYFPNDSLKHFKILE